MINAAMLENPTIYIRYDCPECQGLGDIGGGECLNCYGTGRAAKEVDLKVLTELILLLREEETW